MDRPDLQKMCDEALAAVRAAGSKPALLLHSCCAPCSSYVLEYLCDFFDVTLFFYNPNISTEHEFEKRLAELKRYVSERYGGAIPIICPGWRGDDFLDFARDLSDCPEGGERCMECYRLRIEATARAAVELGFGIFCTTLSVSPHKNAEALWRIGTAVGEEAGVRYLPSDFKKRGGYQRSIELSREYSLYRQNFCGCAFSEAEAAMRAEQKAKGGSA